MKLDTALLYAEADALGVNVQLPRTPFKRYGKVRVPFQLTFSLAIERDDWLVAAEIALRVLWFSLELSLRTFRGLPGIRSLRFVAGIVATSPRYWWATVPEPKRAPLSYDEALRFSRPDYHPDPLRAGSVLAADTRPDWERRGYASYLDYLGRCDIVGKALAANAAWKRDYEKQFGPDPHIGQDPHNRNIIIVGDYGEDDAENDA